MRNKYYKLNPPEKYIKGSETTDEKGDAENAEKTQQT